MNHYRQSIVIFSIALPALGLAALLGGAFFLKSRMESSLQEKQKLFLVSETKRRSAANLETEIGTKRGHLERWNQLLGEDPLSQVNSNLREILAALPAKEIQKGGFERAPSNRTSSASAQNSSEIRVSFRGTFRTMQRAFLELETRMPNLQLQELRITPPNNNAQTSAPSVLLTFQVSYLAWEN